MRTLLSDNDTYTVVKKDPTRKIINGLHDILTRWKRSNYINYATYRRLNCSDGVLPRAYGLPKIHKPNCPLRIIGEQPTAFHCDLPPQHHPWIDSQGS
ncbi:hypothetical protein RF55_21673 [Lasius niger]|uniref:Uncharacterized protein n=1 Tax=Lasius niger TaxID=67767 RepID=A0A0J7JXS5_LASNI|nr:hypothetical protein RF55_21673 [Lasius niger]